MIYKALQKVNNHEYFLLRAEEALEHVHLKINIVANTILAIQLLNIYKVLTVESIQIDAIAEEAIKKQKDEHVQLIVEGIVNKNESLSTASKQEGGTGDQNQKGPSGEAQGT